MSLTTCLEEFMGTMVSSDELHYAFFIIFISGKLRENQEFTTCFPKNLYFYGLLLVWKLHKLIWSKMIWGNTELYKVKEFSKKVFKERLHVIYAIFICIVNFQRWVLEQNNFQNLLSTELILNGLPPRLVFCGLDSGKWWQATIVTACPPSTPSGPYFANSVWFL